MICIINMFYTYNKGLYCLYLSCTKCVNFVHMHACVRSFASRKSDDLSLLKCTDTALGTDCILFSERKKKLGKNKFTFPD